MKNALKPAPYMCAKLSEILDNERKSAFVGRDAELGLFRSVLKKEIPVLLLYLYGPGGQGKTTLMKKCMDLCTQEGIPYIHLDGREINAHPSSFTEALHTRLQLRPFENIFEAMEKLQEGHVLFIDTFEKLNPIDDWIRQDFLPQLPAHFSTLILSRNPPGTSWAIDPGWKKYMKVVQVRNLSPVQSRQFLVKRNLPEKVIPQVLEFTHGHPLALSVVADLFDLHPGQDFSPDRSPDLIKTLLELFVQNVPGPAHRAALEISSLVHVTTESLLQEALGMEQIQGIFDWLRNLSFFDKNEAGIFPHDIAREALSRDVKWRNPDWYNSLHEKIRNYYIRKLNNTAYQAQRYVLFSLIYLHRLNPMVKPFFDWQENGSFWQDQLKENDIPVLRALVGKMEGPEAEQYFNYWVRHSAAETWVYRNPKSEPVAFCLKIDILKLKEQDGEADPAIKKVADHITARMNPRPGDLIIAFRFWMADGSYQGVSGLQSVIFLSIVQYYFTPGLSVSLLACAHPEYWKSVLNYADLAHAPALDFVSDDIPFGWYLHDWRKRPPLAWLDLLGKREVELVDQYDEASTEAVSMLVLSEEEFEDSVQQAIKYYHQPDQLLGSPLLKSRLVFRKALPEMKDLDKLKILKSCIDQALKEIEGSPVDGKYHRVLYRTFINPVGSQERVADFLNMSFSTYRRYLKTALEKLVKLLWNMEMEKN